MTIPCPDCHGEPLEVVTGSPYSTTRTVRIAECANPDCCDGVLLCDDCGDPATEWVDLDGDSVPACAECAIWIRETK